jgi:alpha-tubulin suppressor-like RCC1 family protein
VHRFEKICASNFSAALSENKDLYVWGDTPSGNFLGPTKIDSPWGSNADLGIGESFILVQSVENSYFSWGKNDFGQLGCFPNNKSFLTVNDPEVIPGLAARESKGIFCGKNFAIVLSDLAKESITSGEQTVIAAEDLDCLKKQEQLIDLFEYTRKDYINLLSN